MWQILWWVACGGWRDLAPSIVALGAAVIVSWGPAWFGGKREGAGKGWMVGIVEVALEIEAHRTFPIHWAPCEPSRCSSNPRKGEWSLKPQLKLNFYQGVPWDPDLIGLEEITSCPWHSTCTNCGANVYLLHIKSGQDPQGAHIWGEQSCMGRVDQAIRCWCKESYREGLGGDGGPSRNHLLPSVGQNLPVGWDNFPSKRLWESGVHIGGITWSITFTYICMITHFDWEPCTVLSIHQKNFS